MINKYKDSMLLRTILVLTALAALAACGQKGDLYLPDDRQALVESINFPA